MKKNLILFATIICAMISFTSCNNDKEDTSWQEIPKKLDGNAIAFKVNGNAATIGSVEFDPKSAVLATVTLNNVISGYSKVVVEAVMEKKGDDSYNFVGEVGMTVPPVVKAANAIPTIVKIEVRGNVTLNGKATADITTSGAGLAIGTYNKTNLVLTYGENLMPGKEVILDAQSLTDVSLKLKGVIPGEDEAILSGLQLNNGTLSGSATTAAGTTAKCTGTLANNVLTLQLSDVQLFNPSKWAKSYNLAEYETTDFDFDGSILKNWVTSGGLQSKWVAGDPFTKILEGMFKFCGSAMLPQVMQSVTLGADGGISAMIINKPKLTFDMNWAIGAIFTGAFPDPGVIKALFPTTGWEKTPSNMAFWFEKDGKLYVKINIPAILAKEVGEGSEEFMAMIDQILSADAATLKEMLLNLAGIDLTAVSDKSIEMLLNCVRNGFPMTVAQADGGHTYITLEKDFFDPLFTKRTANGGDSDIMIVWNAMVKAQLIPEDLAMAGLIFMFVEQYWLDTPQVPGTSEFSLGLDLKAVN